MPARRVAGAERGARRVRPDAYGTYAMTGYHQVYVFDPAYNLFEINQRV
jgi:hypothetical protein